jgi:N-succinyldiaminopimelate aminotransferase
MPTYAKRVASYGTTIFSEINQLAQKHNAVNLGQGKPDFDGHPEMIRVASDAMLQGEANQYAPGMGVPALRQQVVNHAKRFYDLDVDVASEVMITVGASEGVFAAIMGTVNQGDEVILLEPYFDTYLPAIEWAGGTPVYVPMYPPEWRFDADELRKAFSEKTAAIIINTPHNPTGRVFDSEELALIAELCREFDAVCIADEVYEHLTYDDNQHTPIATLPNMYERTITVSSAAKTFSVTGWKVGWAYGHADLITGLWRVRQNVSFAVNHAGQFGVAHALGFSNDYYQDFRTMYDGKRQILLQALQDAGLKASQPEGTFYIMADFSDVFDGDDVAFTKHLIEQVGVACIPPSAFFSPAHKHLAHNHVRFSYCKNDAVLQEAAERFKKL